MKIIAAIRNFTENMNPVFIREVQQMVRNRMLVAMIFMYLLLMVSATGWKVVFTSTGGNENIGMELFTVLMYILFGGCVCFVVFYSAARMILDKIREDMMFYVDLTPSSILIGKTQTGVVITSLFYFLTLPFLTLNYMLRGVDLANLICLPIFFFVVIQQINVITLAFVAGIRSVAQIIGNLFLLVAFFFAAAIIVCVFTIMFVMLFEGELANSTIGFSITIFIVAVVAMIPTGIAFLIGKSFLSPLATNRMYPIRVAIMDLGGLLFICCAFAAGDSGFTIWVIIAAMILTLMLVVGVCERDTWETRIRKTIPNEPVDKFWAFVLCSGSPNAMVWCFGCYLAITVCSFFAVLASHEIDMIFSIHSYLLLLMSYCSIALSLRTRFLYRWIPNELTWCIVLALICMVSIVGLVVMIIMNASFHDSGHPMNNELFPFYLVNPPSLLVNSVFGAGLGNEARFADHLGNFTTSLAVFVVSASVIYPWIKERYSQFTASTKTVSPQENNETSKTD